MRRFGICLLPLLLAACGLGGSDTSPEAVCQRQAYDDPAVKPLMLAMNSHGGADADFALTVALRRATETCLRRKGIVVRGGVEPVRQN